MRSKRLVDGVIDGLQLLLTGEIVRHLEDILANGAIERERSIKHQCCINRPADILLGIRDGDRAYSCGEAPTDASHNQRGDEQQ